MEVVRRRLRLTRCEDDGSVGCERPATEPATAVDPKTLPAAFVNRVSDTMQSTARPLTRLLERVKLRLTTTKMQDDPRFSMASTVRSTLRSTARSTTRSRATSAAIKVMAQLERLKFCVWRGTCGWTLQRRYLRDEAQFVWLITRVTSVAAWEDDGIRPGDVLETIGGDSLASVTREQDVLVRLKASQIGTVLRFRVRTPMDRCCVQRFFVVVNGQPIGASVATDGVDAMPVVVHVPPTPDHTATHALVRRGDVLVEVNGENVIGWGMPAVMALVAKSQSHMIITFQRWMHTDCGPRCRDGARMAAPAARPSAKLRLPRIQKRPLQRMRKSGDEFHDFSDDEDDEIEDEDPIDEDQTIVVVWTAGPLGLKLVKDDDAQMPSVSRLTGRGGAVRGIERLDKGHHLASINGRPTHGRRFGDVLHELQRSKKPLWLVFLASHVRVSMYSTHSRDPSGDGSRRSSSSSLVSLDDLWGLRETTRFTSTIETTCESEEE